MSRIASNRSRDLAVARLVAEQPVNEEARTLEALVCHQPELLRELSGSALTVHWDDVTLASARWGTLADEGARTLCRLPGDALREDGHGTVSSLVMLGSRPTRLALLTELRVKGTRVELLHPLPPEALGEAIIWTLSDRAAGNVHNEEQHRVQDMLQIVLFFVRSMTRAFRGKTVATVVDLLSEQIGFLSTLQQRVYGLYESAPPSIGELLRLAAESADPEIPVGRIVEIVCQACEDSAHLTPRDSLEWGLLIFQLILWTGVDIGPVPDACRVNLHVERSASDLEIDVHYSGTPTGSDEESRLAVRRTVARSIIDELVLDMGGKVVEARPGGMLVRLPAVA